MNSLAILVAAATLGVDFGWQHTQNGQLEYLIQIEPALLQSLEAGLPITSELPPEVRGVRRFKITVGNQKLPREAIVQASAQEPVSPKEHSVLTKPPPQKAPVEKPKLPEHYAQTPNRDAPRSQYANEQNPIRPGPLDENHQPRAWDLGRVNPITGRPITGNTVTGNTVEQAAAKPADATATPESPSSEMSRLAEEKKVATASVTGSSDEDGSTSPWLVGTIVALCASLGANFYQGWNLKTARRRYYQLVDRLGLRSIPGSEGVSIEGYAK
jgi:hypothetical protein